MIYTVIVTRSAKLETQAIFEWLQQRTEQYSIEWFNGLLEALRSLDHLPTRCSPASESRHFKEKIYQLLYGTRPHIYRVLFVVRDSSVYILHVRHGARLPMPHDEIKLPE